MPVMIECKTSETEQIQSIDLCDGTIYIGGEDEAKHPRLRQLRAEIANGPTAAVMGPRFTHPYRKLTNSLC
jgi:hypothetical protein